MSNCLRALCICRVLTLAFCRAVLGVKSNPLAFLGHQDQEIKYISLTIFSMHTFLSDKSAIGYISLLPKAKY